MCDRVNIVLLSPPGNTPGPSSNTEREGPAQDSSPSEVEMRPEKIDHGSGPVVQCPICGAEIASEDILVRLPGSVHWFHRQAENVLRAVEVVGVVFAWVGGCGFFIDFWAGMKTRLLFGQLIASSLVR